MKRREGSEVWKWSQPDCIDLVCIFFWRTIISEIVRFGWTKISEKFVRRTILKMYHTGVKAGGRGLELEAYHLRVRGWHSSRGLLYCVYDFRNDAWIIGEQYIWGIMSAHNEGHMACLWWDITYMAHYGPYRVPFLDTKPLHDIVMA